MSAPKDKIADWLESYTKAMEVPYWPNTTATAASYPEVTGQWTVEVERDGQPLTLRPTQRTRADDVSLSEATTAPSTSVARCGRTAPT